MVSIVQVWLLILNNISLLFNYHTLDIDECTDPQLGGMCDQVCVNTAGSYYCQCNSGYRLSSEGFACEGIYVLDYIYGSTHAASRV